MFKEEAQRAAPRGKRRDGQEESGPSLWSTSRPCGPKAQGRWTRQVGGGQVGTDISFSLLVREAWLSPALRPLPLLTNALHEGGIQSVCEEGLGQLPEVELEGAGNGIDVHVAQHQQDVLVICGGGGRAGAVLAEPPPTPHAALSRAGSPDLYPQPP